MWIIVSSISTGHKILEPNSQKSGAAIGFSIIDTDGPLLPGGILPVSADTEVWPARLFSTSPTGLCVGLTLAVEISCAKWTDIKPVQPRKKASLIYARKDDYYNFIAPLSHVDDDVCYLSMYNILVFMHPFPSLLLRTGDWVKGEMHHLSLYDTNA